MENNCPLLPSNESELSANTLNVIGEFACPTNESVGIVVPVPPNTPVENNKLPETVVVPPMVAALFTFNVFLNVTAPVTPKPPVILAEPTTPRPPDISTDPVTPTPLPNLEAPRTSRAEPISTFPETPIPPTTTNAPRVEAVVFVLLLIVTTPRACTVELNVAAPATLIVEAKLAVLVTVNPVPTLRLPDTPTPPVTVKAPVVDEVD